MKRYWISVLVFVLACLISNLAWADKQVDREKPTKFSYSSIELEQYMHKLEEVGEGKLVYGEVGLWRSNNSYFKIGEKSETGVSWVEYSLIDRHFALEINKGIDSVESAGDKLLWAPNELDWKIIPQVVKAAQAKAKESEKVDQTGVEWVRFSPQGITITMTNPKWGEKHFYYVADGKGNFLKSYIK